MRSEKIEKALGDLEEKLKAFNAAELKKLLDTMSRFPQYSLHNQMLLYSQTNGTATFVCGYEKWKEFDRHVVKGAKALYVLAPFKQKVKDPKEEDAPVSDKGQEERLTFRAIPVFDISSTEGKDLDLPELAKLLDDPVSRYDDLMEALRRTSPVPVEFQGGVPKDVNGYFSDKEKRIVLNESIKDMPLQVIKTAVHEISHSLLHAKGAAETDALRSAKEIQAEATAYVVCSSLGLDTSDYSVGYISSWSGGDLKQFKENLQPVHDCAKEILMSVEKELQAIEMGRKSVLIHELENGDILHVALTVNGFECSHYDKNFFLLESDTVPSSGERIDYAEDEAKKRFGIKARDIGEIQEADFLRNLIQAETLTISPGPFLEEPEGRKPKERRPTP